MHNLNLFRRTSALLLLLATAFMTAPTSAIAGDETDGEAAATLHLAKARTWTDATGRYKVNAKFITADDDQVVLEDHDGDLTVVRRDELSTPDREWVKRHLSRKKPNDAHRGGNTRTRNTEKPSHQESNATANNRDAKWVLRDGKIVTGVLIGFGTQTLVVERNRGQVFLGHKLLSEYPTAFSQVIPEIVAKADNVELSDVSTLEEHLADLGGGPLSYDVSGVQILLDSGETLTIPMSLLDTHEASEVAPGFARWKAAQAEGVPLVERTESSQLERLLLDTYQRRPLPPESANRKVRLMQLKLLAADAGVTDIWEVVLHSGKPYTYPYSVVVAAENSAIAQERALLQYPAWRAITARKLSH